MKKDYDIFKLILWLIGFPWLVRHHYRFCAQEVGRDVACNVPIYLLE
jgi:hypothetical protein